jgi:23S rRNA-/tRNA-specific pseudouridylate synthase
MKFIWYEDDFCFYVWKPAGYPSTFWKEKSFLEYIFEEKQHRVIEFLMNKFSKEDEYWLLNRLDNDTSWLLYFAKNRDVKKKYKEYQKEWRVNKFYVLDVYWDIRYWIKENGLEIIYPIAHHKFSKDRMVVLLTDKDYKKSDTRSHRVKTKILEFIRNEYEQTTTIVVSIQKWIRHQIRSHFSSIWYPIVWDSLYWKKKDLNKGNLHLYSVWLMVK